MFLRLAFFHVRYRRLECVLPVRFLGPPFLVGIRRAAERQFLRLGRVFWGRMCVRRCRRTMLWLSCSPYGF